MVPAHERLDGDGLPGDEIDDRLVLDDELALLDRSLELGLEAVAADDRVAHRGREQRVAMLAGVLRVVHGHVGVPQQSLGVVVRVAARGDADAEADVEQLVAGGDRQGERLHRALGEVDDAAFDVGRAADEDGERVAVESCDDVVAAAERS